MTNRFRGIILYPRNISKVYFLSSYPNLIPNQKGGAGLDSIAITDVFEAMYAAGRIAQVVPRLPAHVKNGQADILFTVYKLAGTEGKVRVTDISKYKRVTSPNIIRLIKSCEDSGYVRKTKDEADKRVVYVELTPAGFDVIRETFTPFHRLVAEKIQKKYDDSQLRLLVHMIYDMYDAIKEASNEMENQLK